MATEEKAAKKGFGAKFMSWYESYQGKKVVGMVYSLGASVVIVGALFKILHLAFASEMLFVGMMTEALLFAIGCLDKPHPEFHWEEVFPQLVDLHTVSAEEAAHVQTLARPDLAGTTGGKPAAVAAPAEKLASAKAPGLKDEDFEALKAGIADLAKTASQFSELGKVAQSGVKLNEKLAAAEAATDSYAAATSALTQSYAQVSGEMQQMTGEIQKAAGEMKNVTGEIQHSADEMKQVTDQTRAYKQGVELIGKNLATLNSAYELQLQTLNEQTAAHKQVTALSQEAAASVKGAVAAAKEAEEAQAAYAKSAKLLQKQVADLNEVYGNMLNALA